MRLAGWIFIVSLVAPVGAQELHRRPGKDPKVQAAQDTINRAKDEVAKCREILMDLTGGTPTVSGATFEDLVKWDASSRMLRAQAQAALARAQDVVTKLETEEDERETNEAEKSQEGAVDDSATVLEYGTDNPSPPYHLHGGEGAVHSVPADWSAPDVKPVLPQPGVVLTVNEDGLLVPNKPTSN
jgi:hypothetical protein